MAQIDRSQSPRLAVEELRKFPGSELVSDEELEEQSNSLLELSIILYMHFKDKQETESSVQSLTSKDPVYSNY